MKTEIAGGLSATDQIQTLLKLGFKLDILVCTR